MKVIETYNPKKNIIIMEVYLLNKEKIKKEFNDYDDTIWSMSKHWLSDSEWNIKLTKDQLENWWYYTWPDIIEKDLNSKTVKVIQQVNDLSYITDIEKLMLWI